jgi:hypothetical protein
VAVQVRLEVDAVKQIDAHGSLIDAAKHMDDLPEIAIVRHAELLPAKRHDPNKPPTSIMQQGAKIGTAEHKSQ